MNTNEHSSSRYALPPLAHHHGSTSFSAAHRTAANALQYRDDRSPSTSSLHRDMHSAATADTAGHGGSTTSGLGDVMNHLSEYPRRKSGHRRVASDSLHGFSFQAAGASGDNMMEEMDVGGVGPAGMNPLGGNAAVDEAMFPDIVEAGMHLSGEGSERSREGAGTNAGGSVSALALGFKRSHIRTDSAGGSSGQIALGGGVASSGMRAAVGGQNWEGAGAAGVSVGAGAGAGGSGGGHNRSFSVDDVFLFKAGPFRESLSPIRSPVMARRGRAGMSIKDEVDELDDDDAVRRVMASKKPMNDNEVIDAKKAKRILANRLSAARSKERKTRYMMELEEKVAHYEKQAHALKTTLAILQREAATLAESNDGMTKKLQLLEQLYQQSEVENKQLHDQVEVLRKAAGLPAHALLPGGSSGLPQMLASAPLAQIAPAAAAAAAPAAPAVPALDAQLAQLLKLLQAQPQALQALLGAQQQQQQPPPLPQQQQQQQPPPHQQQQGQSPQPPSAQLTGLVQAQGQGQDQQAQQGQAQQQALFLSQGLFNNL